MVLKPNRFPAKLNKKGKLTYNFKELALCFDTIRKDIDAVEEDIELLVLSVRNENKSQSKIKIASNKISQVEFLSKKLNLDKNSTFLLLSSFGSFKK